MSIKIKIHKTCVCKEYEIKNKNGTGPITTAKNEGFIRLQHENCYLVGG